ncbi:MAG: hypothetical protein NC818_07005 [Candidatus Omnitrophica bacterium]|nr:hypothetical protein [Candidatus Omnitrophota bacterium]
MKEYRNVAEEGWKEFLEGLSEYEKQTVVKEKEDHLLDVYYEWMRTKEEKYKLKAMNIALELENLGVSINLNKMFYSQE